MLDLLLKSIALAGFAASLLVLAVWVPLPDLATVMCVAIAMAFYDFFIHPYRTRKRNGANASNADS